MKVMFKKLNLSFDLAKDGLEALEYFGSTTYDLILMDENMPKLNGIVAVKKIRKIEKKLS